MKSAKPTRTLRAGSRPQTPRKVLIRPNSQRLFNSRGTPPIALRCSKDCHHFYKRTSPAPLGAGPVSFSSRLHRSPTGPSHYARLYHSYEHDSPPPFTAPERAILSAALLHVPSHGFTPAALTAGAHDAGYLDISTNLFPQGAFAIINYHLVTQRLALASQAPPVNHERPPPPIEVSQNIKDLAIARLHANEPIIHHWQSALALLATPKHLPTSLKELALLADEILFQAGSTTVTSAWYTDRAALAAIYASAELYMTTDTSAGFAETEEFLRRRLEEGETLRSRAGMVGKWVNGQIGGLVDGLRSKGVRI